MRSDGTPAATSKPHERHQATRKPEKRTQKMEHPKSANHPRRTTEHQKTKETQTVASNDRRAPASRSTTPLRPLRCGAFWRPAGRAVETKGLGSPPNEDFRRTRIYYNIYIYTYMYSVCVCGWVGVCLLEPARSARSRARAHVEKCGVSSTQRTRRATA